MKRIIPKPSKVGVTFIKDWKTRDVVYVACVCVAVILFAISNVHGKWIFLTLIAGTGAVLFFVKSDERAYYEIYVFARYMFSKRRYEGDKQFAVSNVRGDVIEFKAGYVGGVLKIRPAEFFLLREEMQDRLIDGFSAIFKNLAVGQKIQLIKLDRPVYLDEYIADLGKSLGEAGGERKADAARRYVLTARKEALETLNDPTNCCYYNAFYVVLYAADEASLAATLVQDVRELGTAGITAERISGTELVGFVKRTVTQVFDEREISEFAAENYTEYLTPKSVEFGKSGATVDGIAETTFVINRYPVETYNAWATALCNIDCTKVVITAVPLELERAVRSLDRSAAEIEERYGKTGRISQQSEAETHYASLKFLAEELNNNNEVMLETTITVTAYDYENKGAAFRREMRKAINKLGFRAASTWCRQEDAFRMSSLGNAHANAFTYAQGINSSSLAAAYPFTQAMTTERGGVFIGENSVPVIIDFFKRSDEYKNSNVVVLGSVGGGKSYFAKTLFTNLMSDGARLYVLDPEAEYGMLAENCGGTVIDMGAGGNVINPFAVLCDVSDDGTDNLLMAHLTFLEEFFRVTLEGMPSETLEFVLSLLPKLYAKKGITPRTDLRKYNGKYPTFDDFGDYLKGLEANAKDEKRSMIEAAVMYLQKFASGGRYAFLWNGQTNLKANEDFAVFNFQTLLSNANKTIAAAQMLLLTQYLNNELIRNYNKIKSGRTVKPIVIAVDEAHVFIDPENPVALRFMKNTAKRCRKYGGMQVVMTQSVNDFTGNSELERESKSVITECQYTFVFPLNASGAADFLKLYDKLDITRAEADEIIDNPRGTTFFIASQRRRTSFRVIAPDKIRELFEKRSVDVSLPSENEADKKENL